MRITAAFRAAFLLFGTMKCVAFSMSVMVASVAEKLQTFHSDDIIKRSMNIGMFGGNREH